MNTTRRNNAQDIINNTCISKVRQKLINHYIYILSEKFKRGEVLMELTWDQKGYIWVKRDVNDKMLEILKKDGWTGYDIEFYDPQKGEQPYDKVKMGSETLDNYVQYHYFPLFDYCDIIPKYGYDLTEAMSTALMELRLVFGIGLKYWVGEDHVEEYIFDLEKDIYEI